MNYCFNCGKKVNEVQDVCLNCGVNLRKNKKIDNVNGKSKVTAGILGIFLGCYGVHNFYLGYTGKAIAQIALSICFGAGAIWGLIERIMILTGKINKDANGVPLKE